MSAQGSNPETIAEDLARKNAEFRVLERVSSEINSTFEVEEIYRVALATMDELFGFNHSIILLLDEGSQSLTVVASRGYEGHAIGGKVEMGVGVIGMVAKKRRSLHMNNLGLHRAYTSAQRRRMVEAGRSEEIQAAVPVPGLPDVECHIAIPFLVKDELIGVFSIESNEPRSFTEHDEALVKIVANQAASAIHTARLNQELQIANEGLEERVRVRTAELEHELEVAEELLKDAKSRVDGPLLGDSPAVCALREAISVHAGTDHTILIEGPAGTGKEAIARAIHSESARSRGAFIHVRCAQLPSGEQTTLFGSLASESSSADGAGKFDLAHGGTLYLEGIEALSSTYQNGLLESMTALGRREDGNKTSPDVRLVLSTSRDLSREVQSARFSLDLYREIGRTRISVPALFERPEDLPALVEHFIGLYSRQLGKEIEGLSEESWRRLKAYEWPGNVRELRAVLERASIVATGSVLEIEDDALDEGISLGSYRLVERIGAGGMGDVWLGRHDLLARPAAIKLIRTDELEKTETGTLQDRFQREAQATANLRSPHTVQLYDFGVSETGKFYYVMELLQGLDLQEMVSRFGPLPPERVVMLLEQACRSLSEAHDSGLVHRDVKPANLFVTVLGPEFDFLKILDFGMVKATLQEGDVNLTAEGIVQGTPAFMAPELALGEGEVDGRADLYSLGCVAYWLLTGTLVFEAQSPTQMLLHHLQTPPKPPSQRSELPVPAALESLILRCLEKRPDDRIQSASELESELRNLDCWSDWPRERAREWWGRHAPDALG